MRIFHSALCFVLLSGFDADHPRAKLGNVLLTLSSATLLTLVFRIVPGPSVGLRSQLQREPAFLLQPSTVCPSCCIPALFVCITVSAKAARGRLINSPH